MKTVETGPTREFVIRGEGVREDRDLTTLEREVQKYLPDFNFTKEGFLQDLSQCFPGEPLDIFEGGCGVGRLLAEIKKLGKSLGIDIATTGASMDPKHAERALFCDIDEFIIGSVQEHHRINGFTNKFHAVVDYYGALSYDHDPYFGASILPVYYDILRPNGVGVFASSFILGFPNYEQLILERNKIVEQAGFSILVSANGFMFVTKKER